MRTVLTVAFSTENGKEDTKLSPSPDAIVGTSAEVRQQIQASKFPNLPLFFTNWSTSYTPRDLFTIRTSARLTSSAKLKASRGLWQGMSYWTYTTYLRSPDRHRHRFTRFRPAEPRGHPKRAYFAAYKYPSCGPGQ